MRVVNGVEVPRAVLLKAELRGEPDTREDIAMLVIRAAYE
jgi:hypothetical protein